MKKVILTLAILVQSAFVFADNSKQLDVTRPKNENVKMYLQPGTASPMLKSLSQTADVNFIRKYNPLWSIVVVDGQPGYVLTSELVSVKAGAPTASVKANKTKKRK